MKHLLSLALLFATFDLRADAFRDTLDRHAEERHIAKKTWDLRQKECRSKHPFGYDSSHEDYDKVFECEKKVRADRYALEDSQKAELCQKFRVACADRRNPAAVPE